MQTSFTFSFIFNPFIIPIVILFVYNSGLIIIIIISVSLIAHLTKFPGVPITPGAEDPDAMRNNLVQVIQNIAKKENVWFVSNAQLLEWVNYSLLTAKHPTLGRNPPHN